MKKRKPFRQSDHPFDEHPFECSWGGSWKSVERLGVWDGRMSINVANKSHVFQGKGFFPNMRVKSRPATLFDCTCLLRPGIDVCVLSSPQNQDISDEQNSVPVWIDARISSVERRPHEFECICLFFINLYANETKMGKEKGKLQKKTKIVGINSISVLQKLKKQPCSSEHYRWDSSEDCISVEGTKLLMGSFLSDISWLLVASVMQQSEFVVRSVKNKVIYQIIACEEDEDGSLEVNDQITCLNFNAENGISSPITVRIPLSDPSKVLSVTYDMNYDETSASTYYYELNVRRSKRRNVQPDRFLVSDMLQLRDTSLVRTMLKEQEMGKKEVRIKPKNQLAADAMPVDCNVSLSEQPDSHAKSLVIDSRESFLSSLIDFHGDSFELEDVVDKRRWRTNSFCKKSHSSTQYHSLCYPNHVLSSSVTYMKPSLSPCAYNELVCYYVKNIDAVMHKEEPRAADQWEELKAKNSLYQKEETGSSIIDAEEECSETEMLWKEMDFYVASAYLSKENEDGASDVIIQNSSAACKHEFRVDEEIGILCHMCGFVKTEMRYVSAPFMETGAWVADKNICNRTDHWDVIKDEEDEGMKFFSKISSSSSLSSLSYSSSSLSCEKENHSATENENGCVWDLIPEIRDRLHLHQKKAFKFLWRNIAGSLVPAVMDGEEESIDTGGCVISHTPGAGKTLLIIAFLISYSRLFPRKRPLVLAPKTTLYAWHKEFIKWKSPVPVHLVHARRTYQVFRQKETKSSGQPKVEIMHILDCLEKIQKWHEQPSVLLMGYSSFLTLMREDSSFSHRKYMAKVLRESPGILILDEGHNPRSTKSRLRKVLMTIRTDLRILLSGTLFQNNFCEYFNTLCLARPKFVREVLKELDSKFEVKCVSEKAHHLLESRARKFFLDNVAKKIDSDVSEERMGGLNILRKLTAVFIDVYEGPPSESLPGLQIYTILMNSTDLQHEILTKLHRIMDSVNVYQLELELLITLASIHPCLVPSSASASKFFDERDLQKFDKTRLDFRKGSKMVFVLGLVHRIVNNEKALIFCHNIAPINLVAELLETIFKWQRGREILVLSGEQELFERGRVMDQFEEIGSPSRVLIASITACAEGISLTAASRIILLDSEWNPSKTKQAIARAFRPGQQKVVYVYQLLQVGTLEVDKHSRTTWKEWVSSMIFSEAFVEDPSSQWQAEKIEDDVLREMVEDDQVKSFHMIMKNEKASTG